MGPAAQQSSSEWRTAGQQRASGGQPTTNGFECWSMSRAFRLPHTHRSTESTLAGGHVDLNGGIATGVKDLTGLRQVAYTECSM